MRRTEGASWYNKRANFVSFFFQVRAHCFENQAFVPRSESRNIFSDDPSWAENSDALKHRRPEVAVICRSFSSSSLGERLLKPKTVASPPKEIHELRSAFEATLREMNVTLIVLIDDLDRCLPETTISTLEAIRLFLFLENTAFVIAADDQMIKHAVRRHFEGMSDSDLVTSYFDKLIQVPIRVPPLGTQEVRAYMILLFVENSTIDKTLKEQIRASVCKQLSQTWQCIERGLYVLSVTTTPSAWKGTLQLAGNARRIRIALGLHPELAAERKSELDLFDELLRETRYIGEVGLDGTPSLRGTWSDQVYVFEHVLSACKSVGGRIISIHSRRAVSDVLDRLEFFQGAGVPVLHWYSGNQNDLNRAIDLGCWFSVGPAMLAGEKGRELVGRMPRDRLLTETDGPFGTAKGKPLFPWDALQAVKVIASIWRTDEGETRRIIDENLRKLSSGL